MGKLKNTHPHIFKQLHLTKNKDVDLCNITTYSRKKMWWCCNKGHVWEAIVSGRVSANGVCSYCAGLKISPDKVLTKLPELMKEWDYDKNKNLDPSKLTWGSNKKVWWKCKNGHIWEQKISGRAMYDYGCSYCCGQKASTTNNLILYPEIAKEWNYEKNGEKTPENTTPKSNLKVWWKCKNGHEWQSRVSDRIINNDICGYCSGRLVTPENNLIVKYPELMEEWDYIKNSGIDPTKLTFGSSIKVWWKCYKEHEWKTSIYHRTIGKQNCPYCGIRYSILELRVLTEIQYLFPDTVWHDTSFGVECDIYIPRYKIAIEVDGSYWHGEQENFIKDVNKNEALKANGVKVIRIREKPLEFTSELDVYSVTNEDHLFTLQRLMNKLYTFIKLDSIQQYSKLNNDTGFKKIIVEMKHPKNSISILKPEIAKEWNYEKNGTLKPENYTIGSNTRVWWKCKKGHEWQQRIVGRTNYGFGCPYCSHRYTPIEDSLAIKMPEALRYWDYEKNTIKPTEITLASGKLIHWKCDCGNTWCQSINTQRKCKFWCKKCKLHSIT